MSTKQNTPQDLPSQANNSEINKGITFNIENKTDKNFFKIEDGTLETRAAEYFKYEKDAFSYFYDFTRKKIKGKKAVKYGSRHRNINAVSSFFPCFGRYMLAIPACGIYKNLAWGSIFRNTAIKQKYRKGLNDLAFRILPEELLRKLTVLKPSRLILFMVDISGSMGGQTMTLAREMCINFLNTAYTKRDRISVIACREKSAEILIRPTRQSRIVQKTLKDITYGGTTPLAAGLQLAHKSIQRAKSTGECNESVLLIISDGKANVGSFPGYESMLHEVEENAKRLSIKEGLRIIFLDTTPEGKSDFEAGNLTKWLKAYRLPVYKINKI